MRRARCAFIIFVAAMSVGCAGVRPPSPVPPPDSRFGFDPIGGEREWRVGDSVVFEITAFDGTAESRFYVDCEVKPQPDEAHWPSDLPRGGASNAVLRALPDSPGSKDTPIRIAWTATLVGVRVRDATYCLTGTTDYVLPTEISERGSYDALRAFEAASLDRRKSLPEAERIELAKKFGAISLALSVYERLLMRPGIRDLAITIVRKGVAPNPLLLIGMKGYTINTKLPEGIVDVDIRSLSLPDEIDDARAYEATCLLDTPFGEKPICTLTITTVPPLPPLHVCGGVVMVEAKPLKTSKRWFRIKLVSARRGGCPAVTEGGVAP